MCVGKLTCCCVSNDARMSLNVEVVADGVCLYASVEQIERNSW